MLLLLMECFENFPVEKQYRQCMPHNIHFIAHHHKTTELKNFGEFAAHGVLEMLGLRLCHLAAGEVKHFLTIH